MTHNPHNTPEPVTYMACTCTFQTINPEP